MSILSRDDISIGLDSMIEGLTYNFFSLDGKSEIDDTQEMEDFVLSLEPEKMKKIMDAKTSSFNSAKKILNMWMSSPDAPKKEVARDYIERIVYAGDSALQILRSAYIMDIDYSSLDAHKHDSAIKAKPLILESVFDLEKDLRELREKLDSDDLSLSEREFRVGYPERYAKGEFHPVSKYFKDWYNQEKDAVKICPNSTSGKIIELEKLMIQLPAVPKDKEEILFSDLPKSEQHWKRLDVPEGITPDNADLWDDYIKNEFRKRREGVWFMNNGVPTYITGHHYFAMQWCKMLDTGGYMNYRDAQAKMFYHLQACVVDERCLGQLFVKSRRTGFTYVVLSIMLNDSTGTRNNNFGITSKSDADAKKAFLKYRYMLLNLPFFFLPLIKGKLDSPKEFEFASPLTNTKEAKKSKTIAADEYLNNLVDYQPTKDDSYDGQAMFMYLGDEAGKWKKPSDYINHFGQVSPTMLEGGEVVGKAFIGSTVGAMSKGGEQFEKMYHSSDVTKRNEITQMTASGLYSYFLPAQENMSSFTDIYGVCHKERPKVNTKNIKGKLILVGAVEYLISQEEAKRSESDRALNEQYRAFPRIIEHAFRDESGEGVFNKTKLYEQIEYNKKLSEDQRFVVGNFEWVGAKDADVEFQPNQHGRFKVSWMPSVVDNTLQLQNRVKEVNGKFFPLNENVVKFGCDPFSYKSTHGKGSKGSIHGKTVTLPDGGAPANIFVVEYISRPPDETTFFEDVIKVVRFYGAPILIESNRLDLLRHMRNRGYRGFCMNRMDKVKLNENEKEYGGQMMAGKDMLDSHMAAIGTWIQNYVGLYQDEVKGLREIGEMGDMPFNETLVDWLKFDPDKRTEFDATISSGLAIMACQKEKYKGKEKPKRSIDISGFVPTFNNKGSIGKRK
tara:strand:+ start:224 stop:2914 length:2691 start_codon:yes stop_codon:yes gene_type:complete